jgi:nucleoside-diphosphate-sugar epimerase
MIRRALAGKPVRVIQEAGGEYAHLEDVSRALCLAADNHRAYGEVFKLAGTHTYSEILWGVVKVGRF